METFWKKGGSCIAGSMSSTLIFSVSEREISWKLDIIP